MTVDFDNDSRSATTPDIGADEFTNSGGTLPAGTYGNVTLDPGTTTLSGIVTVTGTLTVPCGGGFAGAGPGNYIIGNVKESMCTTGMYNFPVGTVNGYSPVDVNVTATGGTAGDSLAVKAVQNYYGGAGETPALNPNSLQRYWDLNKTGTLTADIKWTFLPGDVVGAGLPYTIVRINGTTAASFANDPTCPGNTSASPCVNVGGNYMFMAGVSTFSKWTAGPPLAPTAAGANLGGRILDANGRPISNAMIQLSGGGLTQPLIAQTGPFGYFNFSDLTVGRTYVVTVRSARHDFANPTRVVELNAEVTNADFVADPVPEARDSSPANDPIKPKQ
ncbi:MAG: carboxypeptidase-like regulatory domain-containing protein [Pyrinomonadaceae bacterium]